MKYFKYVLAAQLLSLHLLLPLRPVRYLNGALVRTESDPRLRTWTAADGVASLEITDVGLHDAGEYTCTVRNMHGRASCTGELHVRGGAIERRPGPPTFLTGIRGGDVRETPGVLARGREEMTWTGYLSELKEIAHLQLGFLNEMAIL